ncbi:MAG: hypothetical protein ABFD98_04760 [Syntrophobacteraceae bacterium]|nr:hypothetical protein [Desulfobacteraceae bacterium]
MRQNPVVVPLFYLLLSICGVLLIAASPASAAAGSPDAPGRVEMPVRMVVLYSSGVGYFEHGGTVKGNGTAELLFKSGQINDILKSLVLEDLNGGKIGTIAYPSQDPVEKTLKGYQVDITANPSLSDLLNQLRGAAVKVTVHAETVEGTILGVEKRKKILPGQNGNQVVEEPLFNVLSGASVRSVPLDEVQKVEIADQALERDLREALAALSVARNQDKKPVVVNFQGNGERKVRLRYVIETPIWKTSYRLILPQKASDKSKIQGWAIVENQTDTDWNDVQLSLVSGRPVSFVEDLYKPLYVSRPVVQPELYTSLRPQNYEGGIAAPAPPPAAAAEAFGKRGGARSAAPMLKANKGRAQEMFEEGLESLQEPGEAGGTFDATSSVVAAASAAKLGELFQYTMGNITLPRQRSAMFPILTEEVAAERVSIFNVDVMPRNPLRGVILRNSTDKYIMQGPITVFEGNAYAGDAQVGNLPAGQERLLSYAIDLDVLVDAKKNRQETAVQTASIAKGTLKVSRKESVSQEYVIQNKSGGERAVVVEHRFVPGWKLTSHQGAETTATHYRLKKSVPAGKTETMKVVEENVRSEAIGILPAEIGFLEFYATSGQVPKNVREALGKAVELKQALEDSRRTLKGRQQELAEMDKEQGRIRSNMGTVKDSSQYYSRLMEKLNAQETTIEGVQAEIRDLEKKIREQEKSLENYLANLSIG